MQILNVYTAGTMESNDVMVTIGPGDRGIEIELSSPVERQYGDQIRQAVQQVLTEYSIRRAHVRLVDRGALDCTLRARLKTAIFRAQGGES